MARAALIALCLRYPLEGMTEDEILAIDSAGEVANRSVTSYSLDAHEDGRSALALRAFHFVAPLEEAGAPVTTVAARLRTGDH